MVQTKWTKKSPLTCVLGFLCKFVVLFCLNQDFQNLRILIQTNGASKRAGRNVPPAYSLYLASATNLSPEFFLD
ncbi:hypothetical protein BGP_2166 [Beggiatoa sp. PS]|nr:hypothetical protein BGP_2166 [Beggiatoa sp. PS]